MTGVIVLGLGALGLALMAMAGGKKGQPGTTPGTTPGIPPPPTGGQSAADLQQTITNIVLQAGQSASPAIVEGAASQIEAMLPMLPLDLQQYAQQAITSLRAQAAALRADTGARPPPAATTPPFVPPFDPPPLQNNPPPQNAAGTDWPAFINGQIMQAATSTSPAVLEAAAANIESRLSQMPPDAQILARQAIQALRNQAQGLRNPPPVTVPTPIIQPAPPVPAVPPQVSAQAQLAQRLADQLRFAGNGPPPLRYQPGEPRQLVKEYQIQEGLTSDGMYGVGTGLTMTKYGVVPARPYYFSRDTAKTARDKAEWKRVMNAMAAQDPARRAQWIAAANVDSL